MSYSCSGSTSGCDSIISLVEHLSGQVFPQVLETYQPKQMRHLSSGGLHPLGNTDNEDIKANT